MIGVIISLIGLVSVCCIFFKQINDLEDRVKVLEQELEQHRRL